MQQAATKTGVYLLPMRIILIHFPSAPHAPIDEAYSLYNSKVEMPASQTLWNYQNWAEEVYNKEYTGNV